MNVTFVDWLVLTGLVVGLLVLDLFVLQRVEREISMKRAIWLSLFWLVVAMAYGLEIWWSGGSQAAGEYYAGYLIERSLSVDNVFVFALLFTYFAIPNSLQMRVLFWGVIVAIVLRAIFIAAGAALLDAAHWVIYLFGAFLVYTAFKLIKHSEIEVHPEKNPVLRMVAKAMPTTTAYHGQKVFIREGGRRVATPLLAALVAVGTADLVFALDSIPAIFAVTESAYIVFAANAFAVLGLIPLYFLLAGSMKKFAYLNYGLAVILGFVGAKMLLSDVWHVPISLSLGVIAVVLAITIAWSILRPPREAPHAGPDASTEPGGAGPAPTGSATPAAPPGDGARR